MQKYEYGNVRERRESYAKDAKKKLQKINWGQNLINFRGAV